MRELIREKVKESNSLNEIRDAVLQVFREAKENGFTRIGYVSGVITSEGPDKIAQNIQRLEKFTDHIRDQHDFPIFSATNVFDDTLFERINAHEIPQSEWWRFWQEVLGDQENYVTDIFMTPKWEISSGARDEHQTAQKIGMNIVYIDQEIEQ
ncbi:MAG: DUF4406 domain-containing protein [Patescibacteria group bacterium]